MIINPLDAHDRYQHFTKQSFDIAACCQGLIDQRPFGDHAFYVFAHARTIGLDERIALFQQDYYQFLMDPKHLRKYSSMEDVPEKTLIWQPRLSKPEAQSNSMLFKAHPGTDIIKVIWMIPAREMWEQYTKGKLTENKTICESIYDFENNRAKLEAREADDLTDEEIKAVYTEISIEANKKKSKEKKGLELI